MSSHYLQSIIEKNNQLANLQVVFVDIEKYSQRRTSNQVSIINSFTECLNKTLKEIAQQSIEYIQQNNYNFKNDIIIIPTGDGAAVNFLFDGLHNLHIRFADLFLLNIYNHNNTSPTCEKFDNNGWCNCHNKMNIRIGVTEGKGIIYKDINDSYNVAGNVINMAARLVGEANRNQILLNEQAYKQLVDLEEDPNYFDNFIEIKDVAIKHNVKINIYVYTPLNKKHINTTIPKKFVMAEKMKLMKVQMDAVLQDLVNNDGKNPTELLPIFGTILNVMQEATQMDERDNTPNQIVENEKPIAPIKKTRRLK
jgi:hypothetical protein